MSLQIKIFSLGPMQNNTVILFDPGEEKGFIIDPSFQNEPVLDFVRSHNLDIELIICTHAHFDHFAGVPYFVEFLTPSPKIALNGKDLALWQEGGGSKKFNYLIKLPQKPDLFIKHGQILQLGKSEILVREVPGHTGGSIILFSSTLATAICGDTIFREGIGRTDLEGGDHETLVNSIRSQIFTLPDETVLIPGHGKTTTIDYEKKYNPFFQDDSSETYAA
jgi:hydroxyacylglutathione hydrolase